MLAKLLRSDRPLLLFDLETTGLKPETARIVEIAHEVHRPDGSVAAWRTLVRPGVPVGESFHTHKISDEMLEGCRDCAVYNGEVSPRADHPRAFEDLPSHEFKPWPRFLDLAQNLAKGYSNCDMAGKNVRYDLRVLAAEFARAGVAWSYAGARVLDADRLEALLEPRDLSSLYRRRVGREPDGAHRADHDVRMTRELLEAQLRAADLPLDLARLHELQWPGFIDAEGKLRRRKDGAVVLTFGKHQDVDVRRVDPSYWKWAAGADFSAEFKALAREMALGRFP